MKNIEEFYVQYHQEVLNILDNYDMSKIKNLIDKEVELLIKEIIKQSLGFKYGSFSRYELMDTSNPFAKEIKKLVMDKIEEVTANLSIEITPVQERKIRKAISDEIKDTLSGYRNETALNLSNEIEKDLKKIYSTEEYIGNIEKLKEIINGS